MKYRAIALAALAATPVLAAETNTVSDAQTKHAKNILVTATRMQSNPKTIPENPTVITAEELEQGGFSSVPNALNRRAGLHIRNTSDNPNRASVDLRGFGENSHGRVLVLVNGRRINRPDLATVNWSQIPVSNIDRIEVVRGPHSALYGDYAVGGVINIITRRGQEESRTDVSITGGAYGFNEENISTAGDLDGTGYNVFFGHQSADGYRERSAYETWSGALSLERDITDYLGAWIDYNYVDSEYELPGSLTLDQLKKDRRQAVNPDDDATETFHNIGFGLGLYPNEDNEATIDFGFSRKDIEANYASYFIPTYYAWQIDTYSVSPKYVFTATPAGKENKLTLGADFSYDDLEIDLYADRGHNTKTGSAKVEKESVGAYVHDELSLLDNLILSAGARREKARYGIEDGSGSAAQPDVYDTHRLEAYDAGLTYLPAEQLKLFARVDRFYRLPFIDEQILYQGWGTGFNKDLKPETGISYELGIDLAPMDDLDLQCTLFQMDMKDEIAYVWPMNMNLDHTRHRGIELAGTWQALERLGLYANYTYQEVEFTDGANEGNEVPLVPANLLSAGLDLAILEPLHFLADVTYTDEQYAGGAIDNSSSAELDDYTVVDIALRYTHKFDKAEVQLFTGIDNLFAEEYCSTAFYSSFSSSIYAYYPAPERTYKAGIKVSF